MLFREYRTAAAIWLLEPLDAIKKTIPCWLVYIHIYTYIFIHFYIYSVSYSSSHTEVAKGSAVSGIGMFSGFTARARDANGECGSHSFLQFLLRRAPEALWGMRRGEEEEEEDGS